MLGFDTGALRYVFPEELLRHFDIVKSGIHTDKPIGEDNLRWFLKRRTPCQKAIRWTLMRPKDFLINGFRTFLFETRFCS